MEAQAFDILRAAGFARRFCKKTIGEWKDLGLNSDQMLDKARLLAAEKAQEDDYIKQREARSGWLLDAVHRVNAKYREPYQSVSKANHSYYPAWLKDAPMRRIEWKL
jgi:hypothetical protein